MADINLPIVIGAFALYTLAIVAIGLWSARFAKRSDEDFFLAGRSLNSWVAALSASASSESGWVTLGLVGWAFTEGVKAYWIIPGCLCGFAFNWFLLAGRMRDRAGELNALTLPDFFSYHFRERVPLLRILSVIVILVAMFLYVSAQFAAAGMSFRVIIDAAQPQAATQQAETPDAAVLNEVGSDADGEPAGDSEDQAKVDPFLAFKNPGMLIPPLSKWGSYQYGVLIGMVIVLLYTVSGGFRAVCWTDFLQALLMVGTLVVFPIYLWFNAGGWEFIATTLATEDERLLEFGPRAGVFAFIGFLFGHGALGINFGYPGQPHVLVRFMALKDRRSAIIGGFIAVIWGALVYWGAVTVGLFARAFAAEGAAWAQPMLDNPKEYQELGLVLASMNMLPAIMAGFVLAAVLAAICSTADSQIVVAASSAANDLYARIIRGSKATSNMFVNRLTVVILGLLATATVLNQDVRVFTLVLTYGWAVLGASFGPQVILALLWRRASYLGCLGGMLTGFLVALYWPEFYSEAATGVHIYNLSVAFLAALIVNVLLSLPSKPRPRQTTPASAINSPPAPAEDKPASAPATASQIPAETH